MRLILGDCLDKLKGLEDSSVDSIVTDPPYGLKFMSKKWDYTVPSVEIWKECLRVLKPGGHLLSFGGTRTYHRLAVNIEDAGFEIRDQIQWLYGSGFPKSLNISKAIDKEAGAEREVVGYAKSRVRPNRKYKSGAIDNVGGKYTDAVCDRTDNGATLTAPSTQEAKQWDGWGTALKPANEPICLARKPLGEKTVAKNVLEHGVGAINIDGCRVGTGEIIKLSGELVNTKCAEGYDRPNSTMFRTGKSKERSGPSNPQGRWPANVILSHFYQEWYTLAKEVPNEIREAIFAYYGIGEALRALRKDDPWDAIPTGKTKVLFSGVRWVVEKGKEEKGVGGDRVPVLRENVQRDTGLGEEWSEEILLKGVSCEIQHIEGEAGEAAHKGVKGENVQRAEGEPVDGEIVTVEGRDASGRQRIQAHNDSVASREAGCACEADGEGEVCDGASCGSGGNGGEATSKGRCCASHKREQIGQQAGEPCSDGAKGPYGFSQGDREAVAGSGGREQAASCRGGKIEIYPQLIPEGWLQYFEFSSTSECECVGTKKVKACGLGNVKRSSGSDKGGNSGAALGAESRPAGSVMINHGDENGQETIEVWNCHPDCPMTMFPQTKSGDFSQRGQSANSEQPAGWKTGNRNPKDFKGDQGSAARFFYCAKASKSERNKHCKDLEKGNNHPTVKPVKLMEYLVKLVTPPGGVVLDPFLGSGTTGVASLNQGFEFIGIEKNEEYLAIFKARVTGSLEDSLK